MAYQSINPFNGQALQSFDQHSDAQMEGALVKAEDTFQHVWSTATFPDRAKIVSRAASLMRERKESLARLAAIEMGKRIAEARDEVELSAAILQYYADHAETFSQTASDQCSDRRRAPGVLAPWCTARRSTLELPLLSTFAIRRA